MIRPRRFRCARVTGSESDAVHPHTLTPSHPVTRASVSAAPRTRGYLWLVLAIVAPGCGYTVGSQYSAEIRTVHVPTFTSNQYRRGIELQLTEAVQKQIQQRTPFRLAKEGEADTRLRGRLVNFQKGVLGETGQDDARELQINLAVEVTWEDLRTGQVLAQQQLPIGPDIVMQSTQAEFAPEVGQSLATATQSAVDRLARNIVEMMEQPW